MSAILTMRRATRDPEMQQEEKIPVRNMFLWTLQFHSEARMERKKPFTISAILTSSLQNA